MMNIYKHYEAEPDKNAFQFQNHTGNPVLSMLNSRPFLGLIKIKLII